MSQEQFDELLKRVAGLHRYIGVKQLTLLGKFFELSAGEMQLVYICKLRQGYRLPPLVISDQLLKEFEFADAC